MSVSTVLTKTTLIDDRHGKMNADLVINKLTQLRHWLREQQLNAYFVPTTDEHLNEYVPAARQRRQWLCGFTGSAGDLLVTTDQAWLFVDARYYEQADMELVHTGIQVSKLGLDKQPTVEKILQNLGDQAAQRGEMCRFGLDPFTITLAQYKQWLDKLNGYNLEIVSLGHNPVDILRAEAEPLPVFGDQEIFALNESLTGESVTAKLQRLRQAMSEQKLGLLVLTKLDQIAWLYNLRGRDVACNPVFISYSIVTADTAYLFTNLERFPETARATLSDLVQILPYEAYLGTLAQLANNSAPLVTVTVGITPNQTTYGTYLALKATTAKIIESTNPIEAFKAQKNGTEVAQMQQANLKASRAKTLALRQIDLALTAGEKLSEKDIANIIESHYAAEVGFLELSFPTIAATGANSSIIHYGTPSAEAWLHDGDLLLIDSGCQYFGGTTDDTRTLAVGTPSADQIAKYTAVLQAHINVAMQRFPKGTTGAQLDGITRYQMWQEGLDFGHGVGHGVGAFLNVHEGPNGISKRSHTPLEPGMINSVEPGYYQPQWGGIRLENLYVVIADDGSDHAPEPTTPWYHWESLIYIPFDPKLIDLGKLTPPQKAWLKGYYQDILIKVGVTLEPEAKVWLENICAPVLAC
ncbi:MAG: M24 family metallopeptidase [Pseudanabaena sp. ELA607]